MRRYSVWHTYLHFQPQTYAHKTNEVRHTACTEQLPHCEIHWMLHRFKGPSGHFGRYSLAFRTEFSMFVCSLVSLAQRLETASLVLSSSKNTRKMHVCILTQQITYGPRCETTAVSLTQCAHVFLSWCRPHPWLLTCVAMTRNQATALWATWRYTLIGKKITHTHTDVHTCMHADALVQWFCGLHWNCAVSVPRLWKLSV